jgi:hypothetical protein
MTRPATTSRARSQRGLKADEATLETLANLGALQCSQHEVALIMGVTEADLARFLASKSKAREAFDKGLGAGLEALRRAQFKLAETSVSMAIFLGKTYLGQSDRRELDQSAAIEVSNAAERVRAKLAALIAHRRAEQDREGG